MWFPKIMRAKAGRKLNKLAKKLTNGQNSYKYFLGKTHFDVVNVCIVKTSKRHLCKLIQSK